MSTDEFMVELVHDPDGRINDWSPVADALVLLHAESDLMVALELAHGLNATRLKQRSRRHAVQAVADELRAKLEQVEAQLRHVA